MMEEKDFKEKYGTRTPFTVPEGYFDNLQAEIMAKLPERQAKVIEMKPKRNIFKPLIGVAASVCFLIGAFAAYNHFAGEQQPATISQVNTLSSESNENYVAEDYIMMDNEAMYSYMMEQ